MPVPLLEQLVRARLNAGLSQTALARALNLTPGAVSHYERGERAVSLDIAQRWAVACGCDLDAVVVSGAQRLVALSTVEAVEVASGWESLNAEDRALYLELLRRFPDGNPVIKLALARLFDLL